MDVNFHRYSTLQSKVSVTFISFSPNLSTENFVPSILELAIQPSLNASLLPRNPNDAPSNAGQSSSSQPSAVGGNVNETSNQQSQSSLNQSDITIQTADSTTVKADASQQVQASTMG